MNNTLLKFAALFLMIFVFFASCKNEVLPKPKAYLSLDFDKADYETFHSDCGFAFQKNNNSLVKCKSKAQECACSIHYPNNKATIYLTYRKINEDLKKLLTDAQNLTQEHVVKADDILPQEYQNKESKVYGMVYKVIGNAASPAQFYATDSTKNFLLGSLYFQSKPNYDSILPAASYLRNDIKVILETLTWQP